MPTRLVQRMRENYRLARQRETRYLLALNMVKVNAYLTMLLVSLVVLSFLDTATTLVALHAGPAFVERNPIAAGLFHSFSGFTVALLMKYLPFVPLLYATYVNDSDRHPIAVRTVKLGGLVALAAAVIFYMGVDGSNIATLIAYY